MHHQVLQLTPTDFSSAMDKLDLTAFDVKGIEEISIATGDDGVTIDLTGVDGGEPISEMA